MSDENKTDDINLETTETSVVEKSNEGENISKDLENTNIVIESGKEQPEIENNPNQELIHKKNGRLHIYIRQDKYKGELKSKNWVGRLYFNGKQKIFSSGTPVLEDAIPVLEKWFDDLHSGKIENGNNLEKTNEEQQNQKNITNLDENSISSGSEDKNLDNQKTTNEIKNENKKNKISFQMFDKLKNIKLDQLKSIKLDQLKNIKLDKLKNINFDKLKKFSFSKKNNDSNNNSGQNKKKSLDLKNLFNSKVSGMSVAGEEIAGLDITKDAIRVSQVSGNKEKGWILEKFSYRSLDSEKFKTDILENKDYLAGEIQLALSNAKIDTKNVAMSIPVTSAVIRTVTSPLLTDDELNKAIETDSLWENLVQLGENLNEYSIFHQVIDRDEKNQTMDILFVASKLSDISDYSSIAKRAGLNPVIVDVRCFAIKNAYDNTLFKNIETKTDSTVLEIGLDENYLMIIHNDSPIITDVFLRDPEKESISSFSPTNTSQENQSIIRRYAMQLKQALSDYEMKYTSKINNIQVISTLANIDHLIPEFKKNLPTVGFKLFDPLEGISIPSYNEEKLKIDNKSPLSPVIGLAYRKLDVFGYYKFVTAVKNINLLPNRDTIKQKAKFKFLSGFAVKGLATFITIFYILLMITSYFQIKSNNEKLFNYDEVQAQFQQTESEYSKIKSTLRDMQKSITLGQQVNSNQVFTYRALAQIARSVPMRVEFTKLKFDGVNNVVIEGLAFSNTDILNFINNLNDKELVKQASIVNTKKAENQDNQEGSTTSSNKTGFEINCIIEG